MGQREREELLQLGGGRWTLCSDKSLGTPTNSATLHTDKAALPSQPACQLLNPRAHTKYHKGEGKPQQSTPSAAVPPRCAACGSTMLEANKVSGSFFSKGTSGDTMGRCTVSLQQIPSLDAIARGTHIPMPRHQLPDPADPNGNNNGVDTLAAAHAVRKRKANSDEIHGLCRQTIEARRRQNCQLASQRPATEGGPGQLAGQTPATVGQPRHSRDRTITAARGPVAVTVRPPSASFSTRSTTLWIPNSK